MASEIGCGLSTANTSQNRLNLHNHHEKDKQQIDMTNQKFIMMLAEDLQVMRDTNRKIVEDVEQIDSVLQSTNNLV